MVFKLIRRDGSELSNSIQLDVGTHKFGRGVFLDCEDKRVSRNHGQLEVTDDSVKLFALHQNPCFIIKKDLTTTQVLKKGASENLKNGDKFGLLPNSFWYELILSNGQESPEQTQPVSEELRHSNDETQRYNDDKNEQESDDDDNNQNGINAEPNSEDEHNNQNGINAEPNNDDDNNQNGINAEPNNDDDDDDDDFNDDDVSDDDEVIGFAMDETTEMNNENPGSPSLIEVQTESNGIHTKKRPHSSEEDTTEETANKISRNSDDQENSPDNNHRIPINQEIDKTDQNTENNEAVTDNNENVISNSNNPRNNDDNQTNDGNSRVTDADSSTNNKEIVKVKTEPEDVKPCTSQLNAPMIPDPGTSSRVKDEPNTPDTTAPIRERCMYGAQCYRKNPQHKAQFSHPTDSDWGKGDKGVCPFGATCHRRNPRHWRDHTHPPGVQPPWVQASGAQPQNGPNRQGKKKQPKQQQSKSDSDSETDLPDKVDINLPEKRVRKPTKRQSWSGSESENEYDMNDPFMTDGSEDEWKPSDNSAPTASEDF